MTVLRVLMLEDNPLDAELMARELRRADVAFVHERVDTHDGLLRALEQFDPDVVLSDNALPTMDALGALELVRGRRPDASFIVVSGTVGEEFAISMLKSGVTDYVLKNRLERLPPVVLRAVREAAERRAVARAEEATRKADERFRKAFEDAAIGMALISAEGMFLEANRELCELLGRTEESLREVRIDDITHPDDLGRLPVVFAGSGTYAGRPHRHERRLVHADGSTIWVLLSVSMMEGDGEDSPYGVAQFVDITAAQTAQAQLVEQALHDSLTGLPNRALVKDRIAAALARFERSATSVAVLFIDIDRFKDINDGLGHGAGDRLLNAIATRLRTVVSPADTVGRLGGDEFVIVCEGLPTPQEAAAVAERVAQVLVSPLNVGGNEVSVTASIGIAFAVDPDVTAEDLMRDADVAMFGAKQRGGNRFEVFNEAMRDRLVARHELEVSLRHAVRRGELRAYYQPQVSLATGALVGYEALVRWQHPVRGLVAPADFLDVAEATGQIVEIGEWMLRQACLEMVATSPDSDSVMSVNLSARQLAEEGVLETILGVLDETGLDPRKLCLEITESTLLVATELTSSTFSELRRRGIRVAIDDFGTGYASLSYLAEFRPDVLKVDRSFVSMLGTDPLASAIVTAIVDLARSQGMSVVAEGIETEDQAEILRRMGCSHGQGFLFGRPQQEMPMEAERDRVETRWASLIGAERPSSRETSSAALLSDVRARLGKTVQQELAHTRNLLAHDHALLAATLESIADGVALLDDNRRILVANQAYRDMLQVPGTAEGLGKDELIRHAAEMMADPEEFARVVSLDQQPEVSVFELVRPRRRVLRRSWTELPEGPNGRYLVVWHDITAEVDLLAERERMLGQDPLTGIPNRRAADAALAEQDRLAAGTALCIAMIDVDHFKEVNDRWGHATGDEVLRTVAQTLASEGRPADLIARWGGEEFIALLSVPAEGARKYCERARRAVESLELPYVGRLTISVGLAEFEEGEDVASVMARADERLYEAKSGGRNQVRG